VTLAADQVSGIEPVLRHGVSLFSPFSPCNDVFLCHDLLITPPSLTVFFLSSLCHDDDYALVNLSSEHFGIVTFDLSSLFLLLHALSPTLLDLLQAATTGGRRLGDDASFSSSNVRHCQNCPPHCCMRRQNLCRCPPTGQRQSFALVRRRPATSYQYVVLYRSCVSLPIVFCRISLV
jgi:hypothetical protein